MDHTSDHGWSVPGRNTLVALVALLVAMGLAALPAGPIAVPSGDLTSVIIREVPGAADEPESLVRFFGGDVGRQLDLIGGFEAQVPADSFDELEASPHIATVTPNAPLQLSEAGWGDAVDYATTRSPGNLLEVARRTSATSMWAAGYTGDGVDIALIDSGVLPVRGLSGSTKVVNGPDLSFESQYDTLRYLDTAGHGTHMASIMAGFIGDKEDLEELDDDISFTGIAPGARIVSLKVADAHGATDVSQVIAAIDWVVQNKNSNGLNIRVLNLSFGTDSTQSYLLDPLAHAVEQAWHNGIVVVVSAGNDGNDHDLRNPARDPFVIAVGAAEQGGTVNFADDIVADFSNCGTKLRHVDVLAPGRSILGLRAPGTYADAEHPEARVGDRLFLGSGTSQAAAVVSGAVALMLDANPTLTPDQVKASLVLTARDLATAKPLCQGGGVINVYGAAKTELNAAQGHKRSTGTGLLEAARGTDHLSADGVVLEGEIDIFGNAFDSAEWAKHAVGLSTWREGNWNGATWSGATWSGNNWAGATWSGATWSGATWSGATWSGATWSGATWSGATWSGATWSGATWSGATWSGATWSGAAWLGFTWR